MTDRQLKITIRAEMQKGFADLSKSLNSLNASLKSLNGLQLSLNNLTNQFDKSNRLREAATNAGQLAKNTREVNAAIRQGVVIAKQNASAQDQIIDKLNKVSAAEKAGKISAEQRLNSEIALTKKLIKETNDYSILQNKRDSRGRFVSSPISAEARRNLSAQYAGQALSGLSGAFNNSAGPNYRLGTKSYGPSTNLYTQDQRAWDRIDAQLMRRNQRFQDAYARSIAGPSDPRGRGSAGTSSGGSIGGSRGIFVPLGGDPTGGKGVRLPTGTDVNVGKSLLDTYTKLGRSLFLLQYSTMTIFGATGIGLITAQVDKYITLKNQVARTSDSVKDLGQNMRAVFTIANDTFSDVSATGQLFSTINKYSKTLGISKEQVAGVTQAISGAYAASPGTAEAKNAAQYQLIQAITSNRLGGDELRSQLEQAPVVVDILQRYLPKIRGQEGQTLDLRDRKNPINTKEIISIFSDPAAQKELKDLQQRQVRTFSDVIQVAKNKIVEYGGQFEESTGLFRTMNQALVAFLNGDGLPKLIKTLGQATTALIIFGTTLLAQSAIQGVGRLGSGIGALREYGAAAKSFRGYQAAQAADIGRDVFSAGGMIGSAALERQAALLATKQATLAAAATKLEGPFARLAPLLFGTAEAGAGLATVLTSWTVIIPIIIAIVSSLVLRFNSLLKVFGDGINIFDVIKGTFQSLMVTIQNFARYVDESTGGWMGRILDGITTIFSWIGKLIDTLLMRGVDGAKQNKFVQESALTRKFNLSEANVYGKKAESATVTGYTADGRRITGTAKKTGLDSSGGDYVVNDKGELAVYNNGKLTGYINKDGGLPSGMKGNLPAPAAKATPKGRKSDAERMQDRVAELQRDLQLQASDSRSKLNIPNQLQDLNNMIAANIKKAADVLNIDTFDKNTGKFLDNAETLKLIESKNSKLAKILGEVNNELTTNKLAEALREFQTGTNGFEREIRKGLRDRSRTAAGRRSNDAETALLENILNNPALSKATEKDKEFYRNQALGNGAGSAIGEFANSDLAINAEAISGAVNGLQVALEDERAYQRDYMNGIKDALMTYYEQVSNTAQIWGDVISNVLSNLERSLTDWVSGGKFNARQFGQDTIKDISGAFVKTRIMKPLMESLGLGEMGTKSNPMYVRIADGIGGAIGDLANGDGISGKILGGLDSIKQSGIGGTISKLFNFGKTGAQGGQNWLAKGAAMLANFFHTGGVVGGPAMSRMVDSSVFANARRYHTGGVAGMPALAPSEVPAILQRGERVLTAQQSNAMRSGGNTSVYSPKVEINYQSNGDSTTSEADAKRMAEIFREQNEADFRKWLLKERKQGGMLS